MHKDTEKEYQKGEARYIQFPIYLLREMHYSPREAIKKMYHSGIYHLAKNIQQRSPDLPDIEEAVQSANSEILRMKELTASQIETLIDSAKNIEYETPEKEPFPSINITILTDIRNINEDDNVQSKQQNIQFAGYVAICSIVGKKGMCLTNKNHIAARMAGYSSKKSIPDNSELHPAIEKFLHKYLFHPGSQRYHLDKLLNDLEESWYINVIPASNRRGLLIGTGKTTLDELAAYDVKNSRKAKQQKRREQKREAMQRAKGLKPPPMVKIPPKEIVPKTFPINI